jgi:hypothetical protein
MPSPPSQDASCREATANSFGLFVFKLWKLSWVGYGLPIFMMVGLFLGGWGAKNNNGQNISK